jgi:hypothetical protein
VRFGESHCCRRCAGLKSRCRGEAGRGGAGCVVGVLLLHFWVGCESLMSVRVCVRIVRQYGEAGAGLL